MPGITDKEARALIASAEREQSVKTKADGIVPGLTLTASKAGRGSWVLRYRIDGKQKEVAIGQYPTWGIKEARDRAKELRRAVDTGSDVAAEKQRTKRELAEAVTVDGLAGAYFAKAENDLHPHTFKQRKSIHDRFVSPVIGGMAAAAVKPADVVLAVKKSLTGGKTLPNITLTHCSLIFAHAVGSGLREANPCRDLQLSAIVGKPDAPKPRTALTAGELGAFLRALEAIPVQYAAALRLMLLTGVRVGTLANAKQAEFNIDMALWSIPHDRRKNRRHTKGDFHVPLPGQAVEWVKTLMLIADHDQYLLPVETRRHTDTRNPLSKRTTLADWMDRMHQASDGAWPRITPHDLRSTCKSWLSALRVDYETRQRYLDHALEGMDAVYDKADYLSLRRIAAEKWLAFMNECEAGTEGANVIKLHNTA